LLLRRIENFFKKCYNLWQNLKILSSKTASNLQNLFAYSMVKLVFGDCFPYLKYSKKLDSSSKVCVLKTITRLLGSRLFSYYEIYERKIMNSPTRGTIVTTIVKRVLKANLSQNFQK
jgi:hypothetical protein